MELFERVDLVLQKKKSSRKELAQALGIAQPTFNRYFSFEHQGKLASLLWRISELWPDVPKNFLFFGVEEGDICPERITPEEIKFLRSENERLRSELDEERRLNRTLTARLLLGDSTEGSAASSAKSADGQK